MSLHSIPIPLVSIPEGRKKYIDLIFLLTVYLVARDGRPTILRQAFFSSEIIYVKAVSRTPTITLEHSKQIVCWIFPTFT